MSKKTFGFIYMYALYVCMYKWVCGICECVCVNVYARAMWDKRDK